MLAAIAKLSMGLLCAGFLSLLVCYVARADGQACGRRRDRRCQTLQLREWYTDVAQAC